jgi:hypothetical protein
MFHWSELTFKLALIRVCLCSTEGSTEPILQNFCNAAKGCFPKEANAEAAL